MLLYLHGRAAPSSQTGCHAGETVLHAKDVSSTKTRDLQKKNCSFPPSTTRVVDVRVQAFSLLDDTVVCCCGLYHSLTFLSDTDASYVANDWLFVVSSVWMRSCLHCSEAFVQVLLKIPAERSTRPLFRADVSLQMLSRILRLKNREKQEDFSSQVVSVCSIVPSSSQDTVRVSCG